eukprot:NODE_797_length_2084_cov_69.741458_g758_i0.p1 GENE.NODE_797_length_2084_cov_69.741458_g758_i0~~NODE_797_length_2084_cov_69.741458_g758_i0.p1  ORF type:complete len:581 (+),score=98.91 NODE_797_length_2084_cov_69.741458_g758_i0:60-1802(+)
MCGCLKVFSIVICCCLYSPFVNCQHDHGHTHEAPEVEILEHYGTPASNHTLMNQTGLNAFLYDLIIDAKDHGDLNATELLHEHDANEDDHISGVELRSMGLDLVGHLKELKCVSTITVTAYQRKYIVDLNREPAQHDAGHDDDHDDHLDHDDEHDEPEDDHSGHGHGRQQKSSTQRRRRLITVAPNSPRVALGTKEWTAELLPGHEINGCDEHSGHAHESTETEDLVPAKIGYLFLILACGLLGGMLPMLLKPTFKNSPKLKRYLSFANAFSGGVFIATALMHIFPEALVIFMDVACVELSTGEMLQYKISRSAYPIIPLCVMLGYLLILLVERVVVGPLAHRMYHGNKTVKAVAADCAPDHSNSQDQAPNPASQTTDCQIDVLPANTPVDHTCDNPRTCEGGPTSCMAEPVLAGAKPGEANPVLPFLLLLAMGLHSIFAGLAFGVTSEKAEMISLLTAIVSHKAVEGLALGSSFLDNDVKRKFAIPMILLFAIMTPVGIAIGMRINSMNISVISAILQGIACGTFLYVGMTEVVPQEFAHGGPEHEQVQQDHVGAIIKFVLLCVGAAVISLAALNTHEH